jgi:Ca2+-transporting ATPase
LTVSLKLICGEGGAGGDTPASRAVETAEMTHPSFQGLSSEEAARRLAQCGPYIPPQTPPPGALAVVPRTLKEPMFFLLAAAAVLYLAIGDLGKGLFMVAAASASIALVVFQEMRAERALRALNKLAEPTARCLRDGVERRIPARDLTPGDVTLVGEGERLPADALLVSGDALVVDEAVLTGESTTVTKTLAGDAADLEFPDPGGDYAPFLYSGTMISRGAGVARVARTGARSAVGRLGVFALLFCAIVILSYGLVHGDWFEGAIAGITLAIGLIPEEFPMVLAIFLALGAFRLAVRNVLARRSSVTETLGSTSILCVDKTGTLTQNRMQVVETFSTEGADRGPSGSLTAADLIRAALRASSPNPVDPMDRAVHVMARAAGVTADGAPIESFPIRPERLALIQSWRVGGGALYAAKGAPEAIFALSLERGRTRALRRGNRRDGPARTARACRRRHAAPSRRGPAAAGKRNFRRRRTARPRRPVARRRSVSRSGGAARGRGRLVRNVAAIDLSAGQNKMRKRPRAIYIAPHQFEFACWNVVLRNTKETAPHVLRRPLNANNCGKDVTF